jgi:hypothetical protein
VIGICASKGQNSGFSLFFCLFQIVFKLKEFVSGNLTMDLIQPKDSDFQFFFFEKRVEKRRGICWMDGKHLETFAKVKRHPPIFVE